MRNRSKWLSAVFSLAVPLLFAEAASASIVSYQIDVSTTTIDGTSGYLDFQFNPGNTPFDAASATITAFATDGILTGPLLPDFGFVSGTLPGTVVIDNTDALNEHTEGITYGTFFSFDLTLSIPTVSGTATGGSSFALSVWDTNFNPVLTGNPLIEIDLDATTGNPTVTNNSVNGEASVVSQAPEPGYLSLVMVALATLSIVRRVTTRTD